MMDLRTQLTEYHQWDTLQGAKSDDGFNQGTEKHKCITKPSLSCAKTLLSLAVSAEQ